MRDVDEPSAVDSVPAAASGAFLAACKPLEQRRPDAKMPHGHRLALVAVAFELWF